MKPLPHRCLFNPRSLQLAGAIVIGALALVLTNPSSSAESRAQTSQTPTARTAEAQPAARAITIRQATQRMMRQLHPDRAKLLSNSQTPGQTTNITTQPQKYQVADCTGSNGVPKVCCSYTPGGGGSTCDMFVLLCDQMQGTTSAGGGNAATCSGEGVLE